MAQIADYVQHADWKSEKHVPVIECPDQVKAGEVFQINAALGKEIDHPNTTEHHIRWMSLYFKPKEEKFVHVLGNFEFSAHGESTKGANQGPAYTHHAITANIKLQESGSIHAVAYCNIHGLWESSKDITVS